MAKGKKICKVCGAEYEYCRTRYRDNTIFRWQDVACCQSHGSQYFAAVLAARSEQSMVKNEVANIDTNSSSEIEI